MPEIDLTSELDAAEDIMMGRADWEPFAYDSEEVAEAFTEWSCAEGVEACDDREYRLLRRAFTAAMNVGHAEAQRDARR